MKKVWHIAFLDIKLMVRDKLFFFWTLVFPLVFILIFGNIYRGDGAPSKAALTVLNLDQGQWGAYFVEKLQSPGIALKAVEKEPEKYNRMLIIPADFSKKIEEKKAQQLEFKKKESANVNAAAQAEIKIVQGIVKILTELILNPDTETFFQERTEFKNILTIKAQFPENTLQKIPTGFDHVIPGTMVQFILMMVLIYGGVTVMTDRKRRVLLRIMYSSASIVELWGGKYLGRLMLGLLQAFILIVTGKLFFGLNLGNTFLSFLTVLIFSMAIASLSIFMGCILSSEDLIEGVSVLLANMFAALGGCWWPIEIVPQTFKTLGMISPAYWAMDAFHKVIFFKGGLAEVYVNYLVLLAFTLFFTILATKFFKLKD
ncbi:MAG: ABC transporter permease [bacterium]|nr:ABC transporter permease [bacterium]